MSEQTAMTARDISRVLQLAKKSNAGLTISETRELATLTEKMAEQLRSELPPLRLYHIVVPAREMYVVARGKTDALHVAAEHDDEDRARVGMEGATAELAKSVGEWRGGMPYGESGGRKVEEWLAENVNE